MEFRGLANRFVFYAAIGACAFVADYSVFLAVLHTGASPYVANVLGICVGITVSFSLNRKYNFRKVDATAQRATRFVVTALLGMGVSTLVIMLLISHQVDARIAKAMAMPMVFVMQFLINARWTFR